MPGEQRGTGPALDVDGRRAGPVRPLDHHDRDPARRVVVVRRPGLAPADVVDDAVEGEQRLLVHLGVAHEQQPEAGGAEHLGDGVEHRQRGRVAEGRAERAEGDADDTAAALAQVPGDRVGAGVTEGGGRVEDALTGGRGDRLVAGEGQRCRGQGHPGGTGDVRQGRGTTWSVHGGEGTVESIRSKRFDQECARAPADRRPQRRRAGLHPQRTLLRQLGVPHPGGARRLRAEQRRAGRAAPHDRHRLDRGPADDRRRDRAVGHRPGAPRGRRRGRPRARHRRARPR